MMDRYVSAIGEGEDYSTFFTEDVSRLMVDSGQHVHGPSVVRDYINKLHSKMTSQQQRHGLVVAENKVYLETGTPGL